MSGRAPRACQSGGGVPAAPFRRLAHRALRRLGLHIQRWRDPYVDLARSVPAERVTNVVDGGAYRGATTARLAALFPGAIIHAFEPQNDSYAALTARLEHHSRVRAYAAALSDRNDRAKLQVREQGYMSSLLSSSGPQVAAAVAEQDVNVVALDSWASEHDLASVEVIKLDLQGHELAALRGAERLLARGVLAVLAELNFVRRYADGCLFHEVASYLDDRGFRLYRFYEFINEPDGSLRQADALFLRDAPFAGAS